MKPLHTRQGFLTPMSWLASSLMTLAGPAMGVGFQPVSQCFRDAGAPGWQMFLASPAAPYSDASSAKSYLTAAQGKDSAGSGWLRLTTNGGNQSGAAYYDLPINVSSLGVQVQFNYKAWGGNGADGIGLFLFDGSQPFSIGNFGGGLGYCAGYNNSPGGLNYGVVGVGIDDYGNFENGSDRCQNGGQPAGHSSGYYPAVGLRGPGNGSNGYKWLADASNNNLGSLPSGYFTTNSTYSASSTRPADAQFYRRVTLNISPSPVGSSTYNVGLSWATAPGSSATQLMSAPYPAGNTPPTAGSNPTTYTIPATWTPLPPTVKFGFAASTGGSNNYHEIQDAYLTEGLPDIAVTQNIASASGGTGTFLVTVANLGSTAATNALFTATPSGLSNVTWSCTASVGSSCPASGTGSPNNVPISLDLVGNATFTIKGQAATGATITNNAAVAEPTGFNDADLTNNTTTSSNYYASTASLTVGSGSSPLNLSQMPQTSNSISVNTVTGGQVQTSTQVYIAQYTPANWWGELLAYPLVINSSGDLVAAQYATWNASCVLTGGNCPLTNQSSVTAQSSRVVLTWNGSAGTTLSYTNLNATQKAAVNTNPVWSSQGTKVIQYLTGTRTYEQSNGGSLRTRTSLLGDIVNSNPVWVGQPSNNYPATWGDSLYTSATAAENASSNSYGAYQTSQASRMNMVYVGANDGMVHGFRAGNYDSSGVYQTSTNDGKELIAFVPGTVLASPINSTPTKVAITQNTSTVFATNYNFTDPAYTHRYFVDATPGNGDLYYNGAWHTWLVGGQGGGGQAIYALNITSPATSAGNSNFTATNIIKQLDPSNLTCANVANCNDDLGYTYGTPIIRRMHSGNWAVIWGNGYNSASGKAAIFIADIDKSTGTWTVYELATDAQTPNGIAYVTSADLDGDHVVDYLYAGDLFGNVWRFDVTSNNASNWAASTFGGTGPQPLYSASNAAGVIQPITTQVQVVATPNPFGLSRIMVMFGTGKNLESSDLLPDNTANGVQSIYGIWDWDMNVWNGLSSSQYATLSSPQSIGGRSNLQQQTVSGTYADASGTAYTTGSTGYRTLSSNTVCWQGTSTCNSGNNQYGYYLDLPSVAETVIYNPIVLNGTFVVNTTIPAPNTQGLSCYPATPPGGWSMAINSNNGGALPQSFFSVGSSGYVNINGSTVMGSYVSAVGSPSVVQVNSQYSIVNKTSTGSIAVQKINPATYGPGQRVNWIQLR
ncbi:MAG: hypothetical protein IE917_12455 [Betaproteobacteria bacterium]|nr:hypothetical protein [Betaproteobacteria bacterium]